MLSHRHQIVVLNFASFILISHYLIASQLPRELDMRVDLLIVIVKPFDMHYQHSGQHAYPLLLESPCLLLADLTPVHILMIQLFLPLQHLKPQLHRFIAL